MGSKTKNLGLELTGTSRSDRNTLFSVWRSYINGEGVGSNMELIDEAFGQLKDDNETEHDQLDNKIDDVHDELDNRITEERDIINESFEVAHEEFLAHVTSSDERFSALDLLIEQLSAEFNEKFAAVIVDGDSVIIDCGSAPNDNTSSDT